ncbi:hypothetical protein Tco_0853862 [Tanacetum coccineum]
MTKQSMYLPFGKMWYLADKDVLKEEYTIESEVFDLLKISDDLFTYDSPLGMVFDEFKRLSSMEDDLFTYELGIVEDFYFPCVEQPHDNLKNGDLDIKGDDEELLTDDELSNLQEENMSEDTEIAEIFRIETDILDFETPLCKELKEFNHLLLIDVDVLTGDLPGFKTYEDYKDAWIYEWNKKVPWVKENPWLDDGTWKEPNDDICHECKPFQFKKEEESSIDAWRNYSPNYDNDAIQVDQELFDDHEPMYDDDDDDDDIIDLEDYLIRQDASYYVDEEKERFKERKSKLLRMPYEKPPTFKSEKFKVIKYLLGPTKEYVAIKEYEYDIWIRTKKNMSQVYEEIFRKKDEGWSVTRMK